MGIGYLLFEELVISMGAKLSREDYERCVKDRNSLAKLIRRWVINRWRDRGRDLQDGEALCQACGVNIEGFGAHSLRATAATNALDHEADIAKVQEWFGHANIVTTRLYDRRKTRPEDSPTFIHPSFNF
jgi:integrase